MKRQINKRAAAVMEALCQTYLCTKCNGEERRLVVFETATLCLHCMSNETIALQLIGLFSLPSQGDFSYVCSRIGMARYSKILDDMFALGARRRRVKP